MSKVRDEKILKKFGMHLRKLREKAGLSLRQLGNDADMEHSQIYRIEHGESDPSLCTLAAIAIALNISVSELLNEK